jgi:hypothetical protein
MISTFQLVTNFGWISVADAKGLAMSLFASQFKKHQGHVVEKEHIYPLAKTEEIQKNQEDLGPVTTSSNKSCMLLPQMLSFFQPNPQSQNGTGCLSGTLLE